MSRPATRRRPIALLLAATLIALVAACGGSDEGDDPPANRDALPRAVTTAEAERLAVMRFRNHEEGTRELSVSFSLGGVDATLTGWIDHVRHEGYVVSTEAGRPANLVAWGGSAIAVLPVDPATTGAEPPLPPPTAEAIASTWQRGPIDPTQSALHTILVAILSLASDRPDNALLIQQGGAELVTSERVDGVALDVFTGPRAAGSSTPSSLRYWVDDDGLLHRTELRLPDGSTARVDEGPAIDLDLDLGLDVSPG